MRTGQVLDERIESHSAYMSYAGDVQRLKIVKASSTEAPLQITA